MNGLFVPSWLLFFCCFVLLVNEWSFRAIITFFCLSMNEHFVQSWLYLYIFVFVNEWTFRAIMTPLLFFCVFCTNNWLFVKSWPCGFCFFCQCMNFSCNLDIFFVFLSKKELFVQSWLSFLFGQWMHFSCYHFFLLFYFDGQWMNFSCNHYFFLRMHELFVQSWFCVFCFSAKRASIWNK